MIRQLSGYLTKPQLYAPSTGEFWNDPHISKGMLEAHLNPQEEAATRRHEFLDRSVQWISKIAPPSRYKMCIRDRLDAEHSGGCVLFGREREVQALLQCE